MRVVSIPNERETVMSGGGSEQAKSARTPPYTSYRTFKAFIHDLHMHALRFLGLMEDDGRPTPRLKTLADTHGAARWPQELSELLRQVYSPMFAIDLETATPSHFNGTFRKAFPAADAVVQKCVTFFLYAANDAGVRISGRVLKGRKPRPLGPRKKSAPAQPRKDIEAGPSQSPSAASCIDDRKPSEILFRHLDPNAMDEEQQAAVWTLLKFFKSRGL
jgi:hypothetical protein